MVETKPIPDMFSLEMPSFNLVFNISPFQTVKPEVITHKPFPTDTDKMWIELMSGTYGLFLKSDFFKAKKCPTCGRDLDEQY